MSTPVPSEPESTDTTASATPTPATAPVASPDPITGEADAHPVGTGVGALAAGAAGAAIGAVLGPIGMLVGATIGAVAGGLAGHEVASAPADPEAPVSLDKPLPTASSGLITPDESSFLGDSSSADSGVTGEAPLVTESALPGAFTTSAEPDVEASAPAAAAYATGAETGEETSLVQSTPVFATHLDTEETIRATAYYHYLEREKTQEPGSAFEDWITAEKEVLAK